MYKITQQMTHEEQCLIVDLVQSHHSELVSFFLNKIKNDKYIKQFCIFYKNIYDIVYW